MAALQALGYKFQFAVVNHGITQIFSSYYETSACSLSFVVIGQSNRRNRDVVQRLGLKRRS